MIKSIENVKVNKETDKFVFFTLWYMERSFVFFESLQEREWSAVEAWLHKNYNEKLNPLTTAINI